VHSHSARLWMQVYGDVLFLLIFVKVVCVEQIYKTSEMFLMLIILSYPFTVMH
jgi:hypothetical protein